MPALVPAAARTLSIFALFARCQRELSNAEVAKALGVAESSASDLLHTLHDGGWLMRTARSRRFYPTTRLLALAQAIAANDPLATARQEAMALLGERTGETVLCGALGAHHVEVTGILEARYELRYILAVGTRIGVHVSGLGKALLAALPPDDAEARLRSRPLRALTPASVTDVPTLVKQLREVRRRGLSVVDGEGTEGVGAMAVAGHIGDQLMGLGISGPSDRLRRHAAAYRQALLEVKALVFSAEPAT